MPAGVPMTVIVRREDRLAVLLQYNLIAAKHSGIELNCQRLGCERAAAQCRTGEGALTTVRGDSVIRCSCKPLTHEDLGTRMDSSHVLGGAGVGGAHVGAFGLPGWWAA